MQHLMITGYTGFVGKNLCQYIRKTNLGPLTLLDLRQPLPEALLPGSAVIHLAGKAHDSSNQSRREDYFRINTDLTVALYDLFLKSSAAQFFYFSSVKAAADTVQDVLTEAVKPQPQTPYGASKLEAEKYLLNQALPENKKLFIIRPCMIHGPGNKGNLNLLYRIVQKGLPWPLAAFENRRSFLSIENLCFLVHEMLRNPHLNAGIYNFADDEPISTNELIKLIASVLGNKPRLWSIPANLIKKTARLGDLVPPLPLNTERLKKLTENYVVSNAKIKKALQIEQLPVTVKDGLLNTIKSFNTSKHASKLQH